MPVAGKYVFAWSVAGVLLVAAGCGSGDESDADTESEAANPPAEQSAEAAAGSGASPAAATPKPVSPTVRIDTSLGSITVELDRENANLTVQNFLTYVENGHYDNTIFHQVFRDRVVLGGSFTPDLVEKPAGGTVRNEANNGLKNVRATIAMARQADVIDSATAQFFINVQDNPSLDYKESPSGLPEPQDYGYCVFGQVTQGMDVVDNIAHVEVEDRSGFEQIPVQTQTVRITSVTRLR